MVEGRRVRRAARRRRRWWVAIVIVIACVLLGGGAGALIVSMRSRTSSHRRVVAEATSASTTVVPSSIGVTAPVTQPAAPAGPLTQITGKTIAIDPGHNGANGQHTKEINQAVDIGTQTRACDTVGASTNDGYTEAEYNLDASLRLADILRQSGANVVLTRSTNDGWGPCINQRAAIGNDAHADVAISIHGDGGPPDGRGFHVIYPPAIPGLTDGIAANSKRLALDVRTAYQTGTGMPYATYIGNGDGLSERSDLGGLNLSKVPKIFIETGNMRSSADALLLVSEGFRQQAAMSIANGLAAYLGEQ
jgi:N-acetylmuramoyl-L-alanine amidase